MNHVLFAKLDQTFSYKNKPLKDPGKIMMHIISMHHEIFKFVFKKSNLPEYDTMVSSFSIDNLIKIIHKLNTRKYH